MSNKTKPRLIKKILPNTLFGRSLLILMLPILLIQIISTFIFFDRHWSAMTSRLAFAVAGEVAIIVSHFESDNDAQEITGLFENKLGFLVAYDKNANIEDIYNSNSLTFKGWETMIKRTLAHELSGAISKPFNINVDFQEKWVELSIQLDNGVLNISVPERRLFSSTTYIFLLWVFSASIILLIISVLFMRNQVRPIRRLAIAAERFGRGGDVRNFKVEGAREVRQAGKAFLEMKASLQRQISQRTDMLAGVSHDLRTPLTRLKLQVAMMGDSPDINDMKNDIIDMEKMIDGYLNFVRGDGQESTTITDIPDMLKDIASAAERQNYDVRLNLNDVSVCAQLRPVAFKRCLNNIVSNACKYADIIWISLGISEGDEIKITIEDNGIGVDDNKFDEVFKPFYRIDSSRNMNTGGVGLGLPIAMDIVNSHGGTIWLERSDHGGLAVNITLPT